MVEPGMCDVLTDNLVSSTSREDDYLNHAPYAQAIANAIKSVPLSSSLNIGLFGPWGVGKSSVAAMTEAILSGPGYVWVKIGTWRLARETEPLRRIFLLETQRALDVEVVKDNELYEVRQESLEGLSALLKKIHEKASRYAKAASWSVVAIALLAILSRIFWPVAADSFVASLPAVFSILSAAAFTVLLDLFFRSISGIKVARIRDPLSSVEQFEAKFDELVAKAREKKAKIVFFLDDIDRLPVSKIVETLETVKAFMDRPGCIFLVACDDSVVAGAVARKMPKDNSKTRFGDVPIAMDFLDKVFQVKLYIRQPRDIDTLRYARMMWDKTGLPIDQVDNVLTALIPSDLKTPRQVKRQINDLCLAYQVAIFRGELSVSRELKESALAVMRNVPMLAKLVTIRSYWPFFYSELVRNPSLLAQLTAAVEADVLSKEVNNIKVSNYDWDTEEMRSLRGYLARTRHIRDSNLASFLHLWPNEMAVQLMGSNYQEMLEAAENGDLASISESASRLPGEKQRAWVTHLIEHKHEVYSSLVPNINRSITGILAVAEEQVLTDTVKAVEQEVLSTMPQLASDCDHRGLIRLIAHVSVEARKRILNWLVGLLDSLDSGDQAEYIDAILRNWAHLGGPAYDEIRVTVTTWLERWSTESPSAWIAAMLTSFRAMTEDMVGIARPMLLQLSVHTIGPESPDEWTDFAGQALERGAIGSQDWEALLSAAAEVASVSGNVPDLAWSYLGTLRQIDPEVSSKAAKYLLTSGLDRLLRSEDIRATFLSYFEFLYQTAPEEYASTLLMLAEKGIPINQGIQKLALDSEAGSSLYARLVEQTKLKVEEFHSNGDRLAQAGQFDQTYALLESLKSGNGRLLAHLCALDITLASRIARQAKNPQGFAKIVAKPLSVLVGLAEDDPEMVGSEIADMEYYASSTAEQAAHAVALRSLTKRAKPIGEVVTCQLAMSYSSESFAMAFEQAVSQSWLTNPKILEAVLKGVHLFPDCLPNVAKHFKEEYQRLFGSYRNMACLMLKSAPAEIRSIQSVFAGMQARGYSRSFLDGLVTDTEKTTVGGNTEALQETVSSIKGLMDSFDSQALGHIFGMWDAILSAQPSPKLLGLFVSFYEKPERLSRFLQRTDSILLSALKKGKALTDSDYAQLTAAILDVARTLKRPSSIVEKLERSSRRTNK
ncbi:MAG: KAP family P-loop NTPase fold protein [Thermoleophilia bacterium]